MIKFKNKIKRDRIKNEQQPKKIMKIEKNIKK